MLGWGLFIGRVVELLGVRLGDLSTYDDGDNLLGVPRGCSGAGHRCNGLCGVCGRHVCVDCCCLGMHELLGGDVPSVSDRGRLRFLPCRKRATEHRGDELHGMCGRHLRFRHRVVELCELRGWYIPSDIGRDNVYIVPCGLRSAIHRFDELPKLRIRHLRGGISFFTLL